MPIDVQMPDGTIISGVPDNVTQADLMARYQAFSSSAPKDVAKPVPDELGRFDVKKQNAPAPTGLSGELAVEQFKSGVTGMQQGYYANAARNNASLLNMMDAIDSGKKVAPIDDVLGYQDMTPEQRKQTKDAIQSTLTNTVAKTIKYGEEQKGYKRNPYADQVIQLANESNYKDAWETFKKDPTGILQQLSVESAPNALPSLVGGAAGVVLKGGLAGLMTGLASGSFPVEFVSSITDSLRESGVDLKDEKAVEAKLRDPEFIDKAGKRAMTRGTVIAAADAASGKLLMPFKAGQLGRNVAKAAGNVAIETGTEMGGEATAQLASGEKLKPGEILAEGLGAGPQAVGTTALKTIQESRKAPEVTPQPKPQPQPAPAVPPQQVQPVPTQAVQPAAPIPQAGGQDIQAMIDELRGVTPAAPVEQPPVQQPVQVEPPKPVETVKPTEPGINVWESIQNRDRSTPASVAQMAKIANDPDYTRVSMSRDYGTGAPIVAGAEVNPAQLGRKDVVTGSDGKKVPVQYAVIEASDVTPSHSAAGNKISAYSDPNFQGLRAITNGRVAGLQAAYMQGTAQNYRNALIEDDLTGIDKKVIEGMRNPILVRLMPMDQVNKNTGDVSNTGAGLTFNAVEQAKNDTNRLDLSTVQFNDNGEVSPQTVRDFIKAMPTTEQGNLMGKDGNPTKQAIERVDAAIFQQAYNNDKLTELAFQAQDEEARNIVRALNMAASKAIQLGEAGDYDVRPIVNEAVELAINARRNNLSLQDAAKQVDITANPLTADILKMFADNPRSAKAIGENLSNLFTNAYQEGTKGGEDMFGAVPKRPVDQIIKDTFAKKTEPDLFAEAEKATRPEENAEEPKQFKAKKSMQEIAKDIEGMNKGSQIAEYLVKEAPNEAAKAIADRVLFNIKALEDSGVPVVVEVLQGAKRNPYYGSSGIATTPDKGINYFKVVYNGLNAKGQADVEVGTKEAKEGTPVSGTPTGTRYSTLLHELLHVISQMQIDALIRRNYKGPDKVIYNELRSIYNAVKDKIELDKKTIPRSQWSPVIKQVGINNNRGILQDIHELFVRSLSEKKVQEYLSGINMGKKTALTKLMEVFRKVIGLNPEYQSALDRIMIVSERIFAHTPKDIQRLAKTEGFTFPTMKKELAGEQETRLPETMSYGIGGRQKTTPINKPSLWHETSGYNAADLIREDVQGTRPTNEFFLADNPDIALGQRGNTGVLIEYDGYNVSGKEHKKPMTGDLAGREYVANAIARNSIKSIKINKGVQIPLNGILKRDLKNNFDRTVNEDGSISYTRKENLSLKKEELQPDYEAEARNYKGQPVKATWDLPEDTTVRFLGPLDQTVEGLIYKFQDKQIDTKDAQKAITKAAGQIADELDVYEQEQLYHGRTATGIREFLLDELMPSIKELQKLKLTPQELKDYLHNRHAEERNNKMNEVNKLDPVTGKERTEPWELQDRASGISTKDARDYLAKLDPEKKAALEKVAKRFDDMVKETQKILVDSGAESKDTVEAWNNTYEHYVPLFRVEDDFNKVSGGMGATGASKGFGTRGGFSKRAMGSEKEVQDILGNLIAQRERALIRAEKIKVGKALYGLALTNPNPDLWLPVNPDAIKSKEALIKELEGLGFDDAETIANNLMEEPKTRYISKEKKLVTDPVTGLPMLTTQESVKLKIDNLKRFGDNVFPIRINGKDRYIFFNKNNPRAVRMVHSLLNLDVDNLGFLTSNIAKLTRWFASVNTQYNPIFGAVNLIRDVGGANFNLTSTAIAGEQAKVTKGIIPAMRGILNVLRDERKGKTDTKGKWAKAFQEFRKEGGQTGYRDSLIRTEEEKQVIERELNKMKSGNAKKAFTAVMGALSDFNDMMENSVRVSAYIAAKDKGLSPQKAAILAKNLTVNFDKKGQLSAAINAYYAFFNASIQGTARLAQTLKGPKGKAIMAGGIALGTMQAVLLAAAGYDDDEPPEFVKERNFVVPMPGGKYITIPYPLGLHILPNVGRISTELVLQGGKDAGKKIANLTGAFADAFSPVGSSGLSLQSALPTVADPFAALEANKDAFGRPIYKKDQANNPTPGYLRSRDSASEISKTIAYYLNLASGGTKYSKGFASPTADEIDYVAGQITGGVGREIMKAEQAIKAKITGEELPAYRIPLAGRFYGETESPAAEAQRFYNNIVKMSEHENEIKGRMKNKEPVGPYLREHPEARLWQTANTVENQINALNKQKKDFIERDLPKDRIKRIENQKTMMMKRFNDQLARYEE